MWTDNTETPLSTRTMPDEKAEVPASISRAALAFPEGETTLMRSTQQLPSPPPAQRKQQQQQQQQQRRSADAAMVARRGAIKSGYLWKMGANVPRWKRRFFVLKPITMLFYYMSEHDTEPRGCIDLDLFDAVRKVDDGGSSSSSSSSAGRSKGSPSSGVPTSGSPSSTAFELYRSGCPEGSGFMLEARADEDWEQWVESIANGRHEKMKAELDVMRGTNKLLSDEISCLEEQVATFRGYADQRHVTVLALRDERQRNSEVSAEVAALANMASAICELIAADLDRGRRADAATTVEDSPLASIELGIAGGVSEDSVGGDCLRSSPLACATDAATDPSTTSSANVATADASQRCSDAAGQGRQRLDEISRALVQFREELERRGRALELERAMKRELKDAMADVERASREAEERAAAAEAAAGKMRGRVAVLERNVDYLQTQHRGLRAALCQAQRKAQLVRAQKAVLKKEVRYMWSKHPCPSTQALPAGRTNDQAPEGCTRTRGRTWASTGNLALVKVEGCRSGEGGAAGGLSVHAGGDGNGERRGASPDGKATAMAGDKDTLARQLAAEVTQDEEESEGTTLTERSSRRRGCPSAVDPDSNPFRESVSRSIRKRVGAPRVPALPPPRHLRVLAAANATHTSATAKLETDKLVGAAASPDDAPSAATAAAAAAGLGVAGLLLGLKKGMVDKAAQEMGKKLSLWPSGGVASVGSFGSLSTAALSQSGYHPYTPVDSPRSARANMSSALTDSPVRWESPPGSSTSGDAYLSGTAAAPAPVEPGRVHCNSPLGGDASDDVRAPPPIWRQRSSSPFEGAPLHRVSSVGSRNALIQLADLELAEPCGRPADGRPPAEAAVPSAGAAIEAGSVQQKPRPTPTHMLTPLSPSLATQQPRLPVFPPRPDEEYELVFNSRVIGLQFKELADGSGVAVQGRHGFVGPTPTGVPGERLHPEIGDILESYNGISARGKSSNVVATELAHCGRPLRLGFRSVWAEPAGGVAIVAPGAGAGAGAAQDSTNTHAQGDGDAAGMSDRGLQLDQRTTAGAGDPSWSPRLSCRDDVAFFAPSNSWAVSS